MRTIRRRVAVRAAALAALASLALVACGGGGDSGDSTGGGGTAPAQAASGPPQSGGTLRLVASTEPATLDPASFYNSYALTGVYGNALFGQLFNSDQTTGELSPGFAESLTTEDNVTYTLKLREGLKFTDGTAFDAEAVKFNWERTKDPTVALSLNVSAAAVIGTMTVVDPVTLQFTVAQPTAHIGQNIVASALNWIASPTALAAGQEAFNSNPVGAGPFILEEWRRGDRLILTRNPDYYDDPRPYLDGLEIRAAPDMNTRLQTLQTGGADVVISTTKEAEADAAEGGFVVTDPQLDGMTTIMFNLTKPPFDDLRARQAMFAAIDLELVQDAAFEGLGEIPTTLFREKSPFYTPELTFPKPDREKAQALFDELAADGKPVDFTMIIPQSTESSRVAEAMQAQLESFSNVNMEIETNDQATWFRRLAAGEYGASIYGWITIDPEPPLSRLLSTGAPGNLSKYSDPEVDKALEAGRTTTDVDARRAAYRTVQERLIETLPFMPYLRTVGAVLSTTKVGGIETYGQGSVRMDTLWLDQSAG
ncbi:MAG: ABC transporter substrate-binding protein [Frankia sp.]|nr:ABC transporter substrate-binding protein [Frankia sp.]